MILSPPLSFPLSLFPSLSVPLSLSPPLLQANLEMEQHCSLLFTLISAVILFTAPVHSQQCPPQATQHDTKTVIEEVVSGTLVYNGRESFQENGQTVNAIHIEYHSHNTDMRRVFEDHFEVSTFDHPDAGIIKTKGDFNRETMAVSLGNPVAPVVFNISLLNFISATFQTIGCVNVLISVMDIDDEMPSFGTVTSIDATFIDNDVVLDQSYPLMPLATDNDEGDNGTRIYYLVDDYGVFYLDVKMDDETSEIKGVSLKNMVPLNREERSSYDLVLIAAEGYEGGDNASLNIHVTINDICDVSPVFEMSQYTPSILEDADLNTTIVNVTALDMDTGTGGQVKYSIHEICAKASQDDLCRPYTDVPPFVLDTESGTLVLTDTLDMESEVEFRITVQAVDGCSRSATATVAISVEDVNDNAPIVTYSGNPQIPEDRPVGSDIAVIDVSDPDTGNNSVVNILLYDNTTGHLIESETFTIEDQNSGYKLKLKGSLDRETASTYSLVIVARDSGNPPLTANYTYEIQVTDKNDNSPVFDPVPEMLFINEHKPRNFLVLDLNATDADTGPNGMITYELPPSNAMYPHQGLFLIDAVPGLLKVNGSLDREQHELIQVLVVASDNPNPDGNDVQHRTSLVINITLVDVNDNQPEILAPTGNLTVSESEDIGFVVTQVLAQDLDTLEHGTLSYSLLPADGPFDITTMGEIFLTSELDFETDQFHDLTIQVSDGEHTTPLDITVMVGNINDDPPKFVTNPNEFTVLENVDADILVTKVQATDSDTPLEDLVYTIDSGNDDNHFRIVSSGTGDIYTEVRLDRETISEYRLFIGVTDGLLFSSTFAEIYIVVSDENDNHPHFIGLPYAFEVQENLPMGSSVGQVQADDLDDGDNGDIEFSITDGNEDGWFEIDSDSGEITTTRVLDRETISSPIRLSLGLKDMGNIPHFVESELATVTVIDVNDQGPVFEHATISIEVDENHPVGQVFLTIHAVDRDIYPNNVTHYFISEAFPDALTQFQIERDTGELSLLTSLDFETNPEIVFNVLAKDPGQASLDDSILVNITVLDRFETIIKFPDDFFPRFSIYEHVRELYSIVKFEATDKLNNPVDRLEYTLTNLDGTPSEEFAIAENEDLIACIYTLTDTINRETLDPPEYKLNVSVSDPDPLDPAESYISISSIITITVLDINDNTPQFSKESYEFFINEDRSPNEEIGSVSAEDLDNGVNGSVKYSIDVSLPFAINDDTGVIVLSNSLDHETDPEYVFTVFASDGGTPSRTSEVLVYVTVNDINDNPPIFDPQQNRNFMVSENAEVNSVIETIRVSDADSGIFGEVTIEFAPNSRADSHFELSTSGEITLVAPLDRETQDFYTFEVRARDGAIIWKEERAQVNITVLDYNDHRPVFVDDVYSVAIREDHPIGVDFATIVATDGDIGMNGEVRYTLADYTLSHIFDVGMTTGKIKLRPQSDEDYPSGKKPPVIDYERNLTKPYYDVQIIAYDRGSPRHIVNKTLRVDITNVNEHYPTFDRNDLTVFVDELQPADTHVTTIVAYDWDYDTVTYNIIDQAPDYHFRWDSLSNSILTNRILDYSLHKYYTLILRASESEFNSSVTVNIFVNNINNHPPDFGADSASIVVLEGTAVNTIIATLHASDEDNATNDAVVYFISGGNDTAVFSIRPQTGEITLDAPLDYEQQSEYILTVFATDTGSPQLTSDPLEVTISIANDNDEAPVFTETEYSFMIAENEPDNTVVGQVSAPDNDTGSFGIVHYFLSDGPNDYFTIEENTGEISSLVAIDREALSSNPIVFSVTALDKGQPPSTASTIVSVTVEDVNEHAPLFSQEQYLIVLSPDQQTDVQFTSLDASDDDEGTNAIWRYQLVSQDDDITVSITSGGLALQQPIPQDYEPIYDVTVRAIDSENPAFYDEAVFHLIIETETDHHPQFNQQRFEKAVSENSNIGATVYDISEVASDVDSGPNGDLSYALNPNNDKFAINAESGVITIAQSLDYETSQNHELTILAIDSTPDHPRTATATLAIAVQDYNDEYPDFIDPPSIITLSHVPFSQVHLFTVLAEDRDSGDNAMVGYSIVNDDQFLFDIPDPQSGEITNKGPLILDETFTFVIRAYDYGTPLRSSNITVTVVIQDAGEEAPTFLSPSPLIINIPEDFNVPSVLRQLSMSNPQAQSLHIVYQNSSEGTFIIQDVDPAALLLTSSLDYEKETKYRLVIEARRVGENGVRYSSFLEVDITVLDVNDNEPQFSHISPQEISEDSNVGDTLFTVTATDADDGEYGTIYYEIISGNTGRVFEIARTTGEVALTESLDREDVSSYQLVIRASDGGTSNPQTAKVTVDVQVTDINDYMPHFDSNYTIHIYESPHSGIGDRVVRLTAVDLDTGPPLRYSIDLLQAYHGIVPTAASIDTFLMDVDTGVITVGEEVDREVIDYFLLSISATDTEHSTSAFLHIHVLDVNDHDPVIMAPSSLAVEEVLPVGSLVADNIYVTDEDFGSNGGILYSLEGAWPEGKFAIDPLSGVIRMKETLHYAEDDGSFDGIIKAVDQGVPQRTATAVISVSVIDVNDHAPKFDKPSYHIPVAINTLPSSTLPIFHFNVSDTGDYGDNSGFMLRMPSYHSEERDLFFVDTDGKMYLRKSQHQGLKIGTYFFRVEAANFRPIPFAPQYVLASYADVTISVNPVNLNPPVFTSDLYSTSILEDFTTVEVLPGLDILAMDADGDTIMYSIENSDPSIPFTIDEDTGEIKLLHDLDREEKDSYELVVLATDSGFPSRSANASVLITILDVNDNAPVLDSLYTASINENTPSGTYVFEIHAEDPDLDSGSIIHYDIASSSEEELPFRIDSSTGVVTTMGAIDFETKPLYTFEVIVSDEGDPPLESTAPVTVSVTGVNEFTPEFIEKSYEITVPLDARINDTVGVVRAVDEDYGDEGRLEYRFLNKAPEDYFRIVNVNGSGFIVLIRNPEGVVIEENRGKRAVSMDDYFLVTGEIEAADTGDSPQSTTVSVDFLLPSSFNPNLVTTTAEPVAFPYDIIAYVVVSVSVVFLIFLTLIVVTCIYRTRRRKQFKISDTLEMRNNRMENGREMSRFSSRTSGSYTPSSTHHHQTYPGPNVLTHSLSGSDSSRQSYGAGGYADDEMESVNGESNAMGYSPSLPRKSPIRPSPRTRSTSDLASSVGTDILGTQSQETAPYTKAQLAAIYAANAGLLANDGSQDSVHMFGSEGGGEADGELDIDNILLSKYHDIDDDEDSTTMVEDDSSIMSKGNSSDNLDVRPVEERSDPFQFSQTMMQKGWIPRASSMTDTINELALYADEPLPRGPIYAYDASQATSLYGGASTQNSRVALLTHQQKHFDPQKQIPHPGDYPYYHDLPDSGRRSRHVQRPSQRYLSATALADPLPEHPMDPRQRHLHYSQDLYHRNRSHFAPAIPHTPPSSTPTDGTVTPHRALASDPYDPAYLSSSSTSLASTNLSQPASIRNHRRHY